MPNTFGNETLQVRLVDPRDSRRNRVRFRRDAIPELNLANSLYVPTGRQSVKAWILLTRADYDAVRGYGTDFSLHIDQFDAVAPEMFFHGLSIVQARSVTTGLSSDANAVYLVELTDVRGVLSNEWFKFPAKVYYNVRSKVYEAPAVTDPGNYYYASLNSGAAWTWNTMIGNLWAQMPLLGTYPGLPSVPTGTPMNWHLPGVSAWEVLCDMLEHIGIGVSCDLTLDDPYGIVELGADDTVYDALVAKFSGRVEDDFKWIDIGAGRVPGTVIVYFRRVNQYYGTEETIRRDSLQWATNAVYPVTVAAPAAFADAVGTHFIHDDFCVRYDIDSVPLPGDVIEAAAIAAERVEQYFDVIYSRTSGYLNRTYTGVLPFYAGSQVDGVCWKQDLRERRAGWTTSILRGDLSENWPEVY